jgi:hypothetical protein
MTTSIHSHVGQVGNLPPIENRPLCRATSVNIADFQSAAGCHPALHKDF